MKVPFVDLKREASFCYDGLLNAFNAVISSGSYINGEYGKKFEGEVCEYLGVNNCVAVGNGSDALVFILRALSIGEEDEVICQGNSFIATSWAIRQGAKPVFCDVEDDLLFSSDSFKSLVTSKTRAFIPVHLTGRVCELSEVQKYCQERNIDIIEDAAQSFGARNAEGCFTGSLGIAGAFSLHPLKNLSIYGDGGIITTNSRKIADKCRLLRNHGLESRDSASIWGYNSRLDELQAAFASEKLINIEDWTKRYNEIANIYDNKLTDRAKKPVIRSDYRDVYHNYIVRVPKSMRDDLMQMMKKSGVETKIHYPIPLHSKNATQMNSKKV